MADSTLLSVPNAPLPGSQDERVQAENLARRYRADFVDLKHFKMQHDLLRTVPVELMFRYNFVPIEQQDDALVIAVSDPSQLMILDEIAGLLGHRIIARVATLSQISRSACWTKPAKDSPSTCLRARITKTRASPLRS